MAERPQPLRLEEVDWSSVLPWTRLFRTFRMAVHPPKLLLALLLVVLCHLGGTLLDSITGSVWGPRVFLNEFDQYASRSGPEFRRWRQEQEREQALDQVVAARGVFEAALEAELKAFKRMVSAATTLNFGWQELVGQTEHQRPTVAGALREMVLTVPGWLYRYHRWSSLVYAVFALTVWSLLAGAVSRMAAVHAARGRAPPASAALRFAFRRWAWFFVTPLLPLLLILLVGLGLAGLGLLFNLAVTDIVGGALFILALIGGLMLAVLLLGVAAGTHLLYPALAIEGADGFDAVSRVFNYVLGRPWRWLFCGILTLMYGAVTYLFFGGVVFLTLLLTHYACSTAVWTEAAPGLNRFDAILPRPSVGELVYPLNTTDLGWSGKVAAVLVCVWVRLAVGLLPAYAISYYLCANTWTYLLLRRSADGTEFDQVHLEPEPDSTAQTAAPVSNRPPDEVEAGGGGGTGT